MHWLNPKKNPVIYLGVFIAALQAVQAFLSHQVDLGTAVNAAVTAIGTLIVRGVVTPTASIPPSAESHVVIDGVEEVSQDPDFWGDEQEPIEDVPDDNGQ